MASFSKKQVTGTITELKDEDGRTLGTMSSDSFRNETVESIVLPTAEASDEGEAYYNAGTAGSATVSFARNLRSETTAPSTFKVQFGDKASEALGIWTATSPDTALDLNLEGPFGATRSGSVTTPSVPRLTDDGGEVDVDTRTVLGSTGFAVRAISTDAVDDENTITQSNTVPGMTHYGADLLALGTCQEACVCFLALTGRTGSEAGVERDWDEGRDPAERGRAEAAGRSRQRRRSHSGIDSLDHRRCAWLRF